ncbi:MAG: hypothetical protein CENE_03783 [Candidatus Celerinatantimonas neptuna]|nr:MAG: hypothetical protein CENE_03783 [Candidatus Celerinatantimonas neptuna]
MATKNDTSKRVPTISNVAASLIVGALSIFISSWNGKFYNTDFAQLKNILIIATPGIALFLAHWFKELGYYVALGRGKRKLKTINKNKKIELELALSNPHLTEEQKVPFRTQLAETFQESIDIEGNSYQFVNEHQKKTQDELKELQDKDPYTDRQAKADIDKALPPDKTSNAQEESTTAPTSLGN